MTFVTAMSDKLEEYGYDFHKHAPASWSEDETELWDLCTAIEDETKKQIMSIITGETPV